jgi:O-antigen ligase
MGFLVIRFAVLASFKIQKRLRALIDLRIPGMGKWLSLIGILLFWILILILFFLVIFLTIYLASQLDWRLENFFNTNLIKAVFDDVRVIFSYQFSRALKFSERTAYWEAGIRVFSEHPFIGVGLGNAGFFFLNTIPEYGWRAPEVVQAIRPDSNIFPNPKSLWIRLLAETGFIGFTLFSVWLIMMLLRSWQLMSNNDRIYKSIGLTGILGTIAIFVEGFSLDTFGLPYMWVLLGLVSASARLSETVSQYPSG